MERRDLLTAGLVASGVALGGVLFYNLFKPKKEISEKDIEKFLKKKKERYPENVEFTITVNPYPENPKIPFEITAIVNNKEDFDYTFPVGLSIILDDNVFDFIPKLCDVKANSTALVSWRSGDYCYYNGEYYQPTLSFEKLVEIVKKVKENPAYFPKHIKIISCVWQDVKKNPSLPFKVEMAGRLKCATVEMEVEVKAITEEDERKNPGIWTKFAKIVVSTIPGMGWVSLL